MNRLTNEQLAAVQSRGKTIVSASAGSGKTFVMIEKLVGAILGGADLDEVLAVTFTKKAAAQMKEKLRTALIAKLDGADDKSKERIKVQLSKISSADIYTIHSFCARLLRTYFYVLDIDGGFDIISSDDASARDLKARALDGLFEKRYEEGDSGFKLLLSCFMKKRSDLSLKRLVDEAYSEVRSCAHYESILKNAENLCSDDGFKAVCEGYRKEIANKLNSLIYAVQRFENGFNPPKSAEIYYKILDEMKSALSTAASGGIFAEKPALSVTRKPPVKADEDEDLKVCDEEFKAFKAGVQKKFTALYGDLESEQSEREYFLKSGEIAKAFSRLLMQFDAEYALVKRDENKLDYNDLEHLTLALLENDEVNAEINAKYKYIFVDEYQDVNPVQEEIISAFGGEAFLVGDVKQAIYGFRGSKSKFFAEKYAGFAGADGNALKLSSNFRSSDGVLDFVNSLFKDVMREDACGINYARDGVMHAGGGYPEDYGGAHIHVFGAEEKKEKTLKVYSVKEDGANLSHTREGLAVLSIVESELRKKHFDLKSGQLVDTQPSDICILTRKNKGSSTEGIVRALTDEGYSVSGAQEGNVCTLPEVKQFLDVLSLIDNAEQDVPLVTALLSPLGGFNEEELAKIRITSGDRRCSFRECCKNYALKIPGEIARKLNEFGKVLKKLRVLAEIESVGDLSGELLENYGFEAAYGAGNGEKLKNVLKLVAEGADLTLSKFLEKVKAGGYDISAPSSASSDSIKIMTMHAAKGLEFPVVIIADICRTFKGADYSDLPFDEEFGFAPKFYDTENMLTRKTVLRRLCKLRSDNEELKNELNLFYVACTRAMCNLHVLAEEVKPYDPSTAADAKCYADAFDMSKFRVEEVLPHAEFAARQAGGAFIFKPDGAVVDAINKRFMAQYGYAESVDLPVKSSASAILKMQDSEPHFAERRLFGGEGETGTERGTAYHRFLELCDFSLTEPREIEAELNNFLRSGRISSEQYSLLNAAELSQILKMPVFADLGVATLLREQEFLCRLPANEILPETSATDGVLVQGAIDLIARGDFGVKIIDYKYSHKTDEQLIETYSAQLALYKKATAKITKTDESRISCIIVNIFKKRQIIL